MAHPYQKMLERIREFLDEAEGEFGPKIKYAIDSAKEKASELGELSKEEEEKGADYIKRELHVAAEYLEMEGKELSDWFKFDVELVEDKLLDVFNHAINNTSIELQNLKQRAEQENLWYMGEVTGPGTFICTNCNHELSFYHIQDLPACPKCGEGVFKRVSS